MVIGFCEDIDLISDASISMAALEEPGAFIADRKCADGPHLHYK